MKHDLPSGWRHERLVDLVDKDRRITYGIVQPGPRLSVGVRMIRGKDYSSGKVDDRDLYCVAPEISAPYRRSVVQGGDILLSIVGYLGQVAVVPEHLAGANITQTTARIAIAPPNLGAFFFQQFQGPTFRKQIDRYKKGSAQPGLNLADVEKMEVVVPPIAEQRKIAAILSSVDETIEKAEAVIEHLDVAKNAMLEELLTRGIPGRHSRFRHTEIGEVPEGWQIVALVDICRPRQWPTISKEQLLPQGFPVFGANGLIGYYSEFNHEHPTIAITCRGATCGTVNITPPRCYLTGNAMALDEVDEERIAFDFLHQALVHRGLDDSITGSAQPQITRQSLGVVRLPLPSLPEQREIGKLLGSVDARAGAEAAVLRALQEVKSALSGCLLSGDVRVSTGNDCA